MAFSPKSLLLLPGMVIPSAVSIDPTEYFNQSGPGPQRWFFGPDVRNNTGWILCDGSSFDQSVFPRLFAMIGDTYGGSLSSGTVNLPDYRGMFFRMVATQSSQDPGLAPSAEMSDKRVSAPNGRPNDVGSTQQDMVMNHSHPYNEFSQQTVPTIPAGSDPPASGIDKTALTGSQVYDPSVKVSTAPPQLSGSESRPKNIYVNYLIYAGSVPADNTSFF